MVINKQDIRIEKSRSAGILLPVFSLPSPYGIGAFGHAAYSWIDFLEQSGQSYWQVLPLGPTSYGDSPYQSFSAFAGNPYFIDLDILCRDGLLEEHEYNTMRWGAIKRRIEYKTLFDNRDTLLRKAYYRFSNKNALDIFRSNNADWLVDYALFMAIKSKIGAMVWNQWREDIRHRDPCAMDRWRNELQEDIEYNIFVQYQFYKQWTALKAYANNKGIGIIGDIPIYVSMDSSDTWANSELFLLDENKQPIDVAGCPPDYFSKTGQLWGNPLYNWNVHRQQKYRWWIRRMRASLSLYDIVRIDHFRGFESYYAIPNGSKDAKPGVWRSGPGMDLVNILNREFGQGRVIAEDLGFLTDEVRELLENSGYPGMKILQFAFDSREESDYLPHNYQRHCVVYTGTHDNDTTKGWFSSASADDVKLAKEYLGIDDAEKGSLVFIRAALSSVGNLAIIPMQDYLNLGSEARINTPSTLGGDNWCWRMAGDEATPKLAQKIFKLMELYGRKSV
jgi:4-alpha-glucanotransferase